MLDLGSSDSGFESQHPDQYFRCKNAFPRSEYAYTPSLVSHIFPHGNIGRGEKARRLAFVWDSKPDLGWWNKILAPGLVPAEIFCGSAIII